MALERLKCTFVENLGNQTHVFENHNPGTVTDGDAG
jgi:hypothetical protein